MEADDWLSVAQAAEISGYNEQYIRRLVRCGRLKARKFATVWQVSKAALVEYLKEGQKSGDKRRGPKFD